MASTRSTMFRLSLPARSPVAQRRAACLVLALAACSAWAAPASGAPEDDASRVRLPVSNRASQDLARLAREYWDGHLRAHPVTATQLGDRRYDDKLEDNTPSGILAEQRRLEWVKRRAEAIPEGPLPPPDRLTRAALLEEVGGQLANLGCHFEDWVVDPLGGPQVDLQNLADFTRIATPRDADRYVARCRAAAAYVDQHVTNLRGGLGRERVASVEGVRKVIEQLRGLEAKRVKEWAVYRPVLERRDDWSLRDRDRFAQQLELVVEGALAPALLRYREFLEREVLPAARSAEKPGLAALPDGDACYRARIRTETSLDLSPEDLHRTGLEEVARFRRELGALGAKVFGTSDVAEIQRRLRADPAMHFANAAEVEHTAREALARARAAMPKWFGILPKADCEVKVMGMHEAPQSTIAYYRQPAIDGSRPGLYMLNTYKPETRPRYEAEALAFHEAIPGHHLQIAIAQELQGLPDFRKHQGVTAYFEGWALYTERLADEMGLYSSDLDRIGMLSFDAWRACRLVVDTGIHAMGWSRQKAIDYMVENTVLAENNIVNEVDRYITWPGQALAYKCGQLEILKLRAEAKAKLGDRFDIREFHDAVLERGAVALPVLRKQIEAWVETRLASTAGG